MKIERKRFRFAALVACIALMIVGTAPGVSAQTGLKIVHDDYDALDVNHVEITELKLSEGEFSTDNPDISIGEFMEHAADKDTAHKALAIAYTGDVKWGESNTTATHDAVMARNSIPGTFSLRFDNKAVLSDGVKADVVLLFSDWDLYLGAKPEDVSSGGKVSFLCISGGKDGATLHYVIESPRRGPGEDDALVCSVKQRLKTTIKIIKHGTNEVIDDKYDNMLVGFRDLDVPDYSVASGKDDSERYAGRFAESIELVSGFSEPLLTTDASKSKVKINTVDGDMVISGTEPDSNSLDSGFICGASPQGYSYYWAGATQYRNDRKGLNYVSTKIAEMSKVSVGASAGPGGSIEKEGSTDYVLNGVTSYRYEPVDGYYVASLVVDGESEDFDAAGGTYTFKKLTETNQEGDDHTIKVAFEAYPEIEIEKNVSNETPDTGDEIEYTIEIRQTNDEAVLKNAVMTDAIPEGIKVIEETIDCSEDGKVDFENGVITYRQDELGGDAVVTFKAVVAETSGEVKNTASLWGDMVDKIQDDAVITVSQGDDDNENEDDYGGEDEDPGSDDDVNDEPPHGSRSEVPLDDEDPEEGGDYYEYDPDIPKTSDTSPSSVLVLLGTVALSAVTIWRFIMKMHRIG